MDIAEDEGVDVSDPGYAAQSPWNQPPIHRPAPRAPQPEPVTPPESLPPPGSPAAEADQAPASGVPVPLPPPRPVYGEPAHREPPRPPSGEPSRPLRATAPPVYGEPARPVPGQTRARFMEPRGRGVTPARPVRPRVRRLSRRSARVTRPGTGVARGRAAGADLFGREPTLFQPRRTLNADRRRPAPR